MSNLDIDYFRKTFERMEDVDLTGGVSEECIASAESALDLKFPPGYKAFLREFGSGYVSSEGVIGLGGPKHHDVVWMTKELRARHYAAFSNSFIPIRNDGFGNYDCIDTSQTTTNGEYLIIQRLHDGNDLENKIVAHTFYDWLQEIILIASQGSESD